MQKPILVIILALTMTSSAMAEHAKIPRPAVTLVTAKAVTKPEKATERRACLLKNCLAPRRRLRRSQLAR